MSIPMPPKLDLLQHPSAWHGNTLTQHPTQWCYTLTTAEISELEQAAECFIQQPEGDLTQICPASFPLPLLSSKLQALHQQLINGLGFELWRGLPINRYSLTEAAVIFCGLGSYLGAACSQNAQGHLLGHVKDTSANAQDNDVRIYQTAQRQTFHTDSADVVGLLCLHAARSGGDSMLVSTVSIYNALAQECPELLVELFKPIATDRRGEVPAGEKPYFEIPLLNWFDGQLTGMYQRQYIESAIRHPGVPELSETYVQALDAFDRIANNPDMHLKMRLQPGDMQFVHNHSLLHDRTSFIDWSEPERRRHLLRLWLSVPGDRQLPGVFKQRFGSIDVGQRGGIKTATTTLCVPLATN